MFAFLKRLLGFGRKAEVVGNIGRKAPIHFEGNRLRFDNAEMVNLRELETAIPCFLTIAMMPLTYSISLGLAFGFVSYVLIKVFVGKAREVNIILWIVAVFSFLEITGLMKSFIANLF